MSTEELLAGPADGPLETVIEEENLAASLCYTSGTTGNPQGVLYSHRSIVLHSLLLLGAYVLALSERDVAAPVVPMFHVNTWDDRDQSRRHHLPAGDPPRRTPERVEMVTEIPKTATGKWSKQTLRQRFADSVTEAHAP